MILTSVNLGNRRTVQDQAAQLASNAADGTQVIAGVEAVARVAGLLSGWNGKQVARSSGDLSGEAVAWAPGIHVLRTGAAYACGPDPAGLSERFYPWADIATRIGGVRVIAVHRAPRRDGFPERIWPEADARLRRVIRRARWRGLLVAVGGDWNEPLDHDPAELHQRAGLVWLGHRIDGWAVSPRLARHAEMTWVPDGRRDDHDVVTLMIHKETP